MLCCDTPKVLGAKRRYEVGLEKLAFASEQVSQMQKELEELQPVLKKSQEETAALMDKIQARLPEVEWAPLSLHRAASDNLMVCCRWRKRELLSRPRLMWPMLRLRRLQQRRRNAKMT